MKATKATQEYKNLKSIKEKLAFDASGRPGATDIKAYQERIKDKMRAFKQEAWRNINSGNAIYNGYSHKARFAQFLVDSETTAYQERDQREGSPRTMLNLPVEAEQPANIAGWFYTTKTDVEKDYNRYSKGWHRKYGAAKTIVHTVTFARMGSDGQIETKHHNPKTLNGEYAVNAAIALDIIEPVKSKVSLKIRLKNVFDASLVADKRGYKIYSRTLAGQHYDWVIVSPMGVVYHDNDRDALIEGLRLKIRAAASKLSLDGPLINWDACKKLGFCDTGIKSFCADFGLNTQQKYTPKEIEAAVRANPGRAYPYMAELRTLAEAYNYAVNWA